MRNRYLLDWQDILILFLGVVLVWVGVAVSLLLFRGTPPVPDNSKMIERLQDQYELEKAKADSLSKVANEHFETAKILMNEIDQNSRFVWSSSASERDSLRAIYNPK